VKTLVLGASGMLGHQMVRRLQASFPDTWWTLRGRRDDPDLAPASWLTGTNALEGVDAMDLPALESIIDELRPDVVVNCLGVIKQRAASQDSIASITINSLLPHRLAALLERGGGRLVHISTDCVFSGRRGNYAESDLSDADDLYGRTKYLGEVAYPNSLTIRTSIIGRELRHHHSLLDWFLSQRGQTIRGFRRHWWSGVTTLHLSEVVARGLECWPTLSGLYQLSSGRISKYDLLMLLRAGFRLDVEIEPDDAPHCDRSLVGDRFQAATGHQCPPWPALIAELASDPTPYPALGT
jgi:dTDP-4-dehydrorhamnose reductase